MNSAVCSLGDSVSRCLAKLDCHDAGMLSTVDDIRRRQRLSGAHQQQRHDRVLAIETVVSAGLVPVYRGRLQGEPLEHGRETANLTATTRGAEKQNKYFWGKDGEIISPCLPRSCSTAAV